MQNYVIPAFNALPPGPAQLAAASLLNSQLDHLSGEKDTLARELLRCHEQLRLVFDLAAHVTQLDDPDAIQDVLLQRYGMIVAAGAVFLDQAGCCRQVDLGPTDAPAPFLTPNEVRAALAAEVEDVRQTRCAQAPQSVPRIAALLGGAHVMLSALRRPDAETGVVIALRAAGEPPFDQGDVLAAESVLVYGAQVLSNVALVRNLRRTALETLCTLVNAIDAKDNYTAGHSERVGGYARLVGAELGLPAARLQTLEWAGLLHDVGKIGVPEHILNKPSALTEDERDAVRRHCRVGHEVLRPVAQFEPVLETVLYHHENWDGSGYPEGLRGDQIPLDARIIHIVDIFDALTTNRPYRRRYSLEQALRILQQTAGQATDPRLAELFIATLRQCLRERTVAFRARFGHLLDGEPQSAPAP